MKEGTFLILVIVINVISISAQSYTIKGTLNGVKDGWVYVRHRQLEITDSGKIVNSKFSVSGVILKPEFCAFGISYNGIKDYYFGLFVESGQFTISCEINKLNDTAIYFTGSKAESEFQDFQKKVAFINSKHYKQLLAERKMEALTRNFALSHPNSYISAFAIYSYIKKQLLLHKLYCSLGMDIQSSYYGKLIAQKLVNPYCNIHNKGFVIK